MNETLKLWFFRDLNDEQRLKLFGLFGLPVDEIGNVHGRQTIALQHIVGKLVELVRGESAAPAPAPNAVAPVTTGQGVEVKPLTKTQIETLANNIHNVDDFAYTVECLSFHLSGSALFTQDHQGGEVEAMKAAAKVFFDMRTTATISIPQYSPYDAFVGGWTAAIAQQPLSVQEGSPDDH